jgi:hypothetical protein
MAVAFGAVTTDAPAADDPTDLYAYYYIWFNVSSWNRAKIDYPLLGRYSSDETSIMRSHIRMAKRAGINGFIVSWKSTATLDERLARLARVARSERFKLSLIYQGLDFERRPLPVAKISSDLRGFARRYGTSPVFRRGQKPMVIWSGTWKFSPADIERVSNSVRDRMLLLGTERNAEDYLAKAAALDGNAYYWSSVNPDTYPDHPGKLRALGLAVHDKGGLWIAPAAPGFDARKVGGTTVVPRRDGETLRRQLDAAQQSDPDAIGLISWNEFSENTQVEPSRMYKTKALEVLADIRGTQFDAKGELDSSLPAGRLGGGGSIPLVVAFGLCLLGVVLVLARRRASLRRSA